METKGLIKKGLTYLLASCLFLGTATQTSYAQVQNNKDKYAVIISGHPDDFEDKQIFSVYHAFRQLGFKEKNIFILEKYGKKRKLYPVRASATRYTINALFFNLSRWIDENDMLFVYIGDHGRRETYSLEGGRGKIDLSEIALPGQNVNELELKSSLDEIHSEVTIVFADICYGGGFAKRFSEGHYVGISSSGKEEPAWMSPSHRFGVYFMNAHLDKETSDKNKDGTVSLQEAFDYAEKKHPWTKIRDSQFPHTPYIRSELDLEELTIE